MEYAIKAENLVKVYGKGRTRVEAVKDVSLAVRHGEVFAIMGPTGSGKTTLLMILGLVTEPSEGRMILEGENIYNSHRLGLQRLRREKVGFVFQLPNLIPFLTAKENVLLPLELIGIPRRQAESRARDLLEYLEVADRADLLPELLSGGEKQRVAVARALAHRPAIILADEPTASLDTEHGLAVMRLLRRVSKEQGSAILVVTHDTRMTSEVDRVIHLRDGSIVDENNSTGKLSEPQQDGI
jgi:putative ABC transport system ATP-binding protein